MRSPLRSRRLLESARRPGCVCAWPNRLAFRRYVSLIAVHAVAKFVLVTYALSWSLTLPLLVGGNGLGLLPYAVPAGPAFALIVLQSYGPFGAALLCSTPHQRRVILRRLARWGGGWLIRILCVAGPPLSVLLGSLVVGGASTLDELRGGFGLALSFVVNLPVLLLLGGPLGEEAGWRGFALPRLQAQMGPIAASLVIGLVWAVWHAPNFFIPAMGTWDGSKAAYLALAVILSLAHAGAFNLSGGSLLAVILLHASIDASTRTLLPPMFAEDRVGGTVALFVAFAVLLVAIAGRGGLTSGDVPAPAKDAELRPA